MENYPGLTWRKPSFSRFNQNCAQIAQDPATGDVLLANDRRPGQEPQRFDRGEWDALVKGVKAGEFDF